MAVKQKSLNRTLALKPIVFAKEINKKLAELLMEADKACATVGERIMHDMVIGVDGPIPDYSYFYNNLEFYENGAVFFELWSFIPGRMPAGFTPDLNAKNAKYDVAQIVDGNGNAKELIQISHVLVYKNAAIVEATKGTGGAFLVEKYLNKLLRERCAKRPPHVAFTTAISSDLLNEILQGGGAVSISLGMVGAKQESDNKVVGLLSDAHSVFSKTELVTLSWSAGSKSTLSAEEVVTEARTAKDDNLDKIFIKLKHGSIKGLSKYRITSPISIRDAGGRNPDHKEVKEAMIDYLGRLLQPDAKGRRMLDDEGNLINNG